MGLTLEMSILPFSTKRKRNRSGLRTAWRLFCFPYAGGSALAIYRSWSESLPASTELIPVQLPGRGERAAEAPISRLADLIPQLAKELSPFGEVPFAFYGHSMGALIAFELARYLEKSGTSRVSHLFASSCAAPCLARTEPPLHQLPDAALLCRLNRLQGTPPEVLAHPELMKNALALFRADLALCETYLYAPGERLDCPISVFGGLQDPIVTLSSLERWRDMTGGEFRLNMFEGNHFFIKQARLSLLEIVSSRLFAQGRSETAHTKQQLAAVQNDL